MAESNAIGKRPKSVDGGTGVVSRVFSTDKKA
jgi:hypothetical protein